MWRWVGWWLCALRVALAVLLAAHFGAAIAAEPPRYLAVPLGSLGGGASLAAAINARGDVAGQSTTAGGAVHAFIHADGIMRDLGTLGGGFSEAYAINGNGWTTGRSYATASDDYAFVSDGTVMTGLFAAGKGATGHGINDAGHVTGRMFVAGASRAFLYANGTVTNLGGFGEASSFGAGINARGEVIVVAYTFPGGGATRSFVVFGEVATPLGTLGGASTFATAINERGDVTGGSETATGDFHAFLYANGTMTDLGTLAPGPGRSSGGAGINGARDVVGDAYTADGRRHAILITGGRVYDLNALVLGGLAPGDDLRFASAINDRGQIVANAICETVITPVQPCHAYRLDPVPSTAEVPALGPVSLAMLAIVLVILTRRPLTLRPGARQR